jgi:SAM-dependent methyltransferase
MKENPEQALYRKLYDQQQAGQYNDGYGHSNHGERHLRAILMMEPESVLDVGCGHNEFAKALRAKGLNAKGMDFACPSADIIGDVIRIPVNSKQFDLVTAFDVLEHLLPEQVEPALREMRRVSIRFAFTISHVPSHHKSDGRTLHPTVRPPEWWETTIGRFGDLMSRSHGLWSGEWWLG